LKKIALLICINIVIAIGLFMFFNKSFPHDYYEVINDQGKTARITTLPFSFFTGEQVKHTAVFYRLGNRQEMQDKLNHYVESLTSCYDDGAFCDTEQDITVYSYVVSEGFLLHKITLVYDTIDLKDLENSKGLDIQTLILGGEPYRLQQGDSYVANEWTGTPEYRLNQTTYDAPAVTGRGITIGDALDKVISAYDVKTDYALWEVRKSFHSDGDYTIESRNYVMGEFDETGVQRASLMIAYYRLETQWIPLTSQEIDQYIAFLTGETAEKPYDGIVLYQFQFPFNGFSSVVTDKTVASFTVDFPLGQE
jgi:hypothetical protein